MDLGQMPWGPFDALGKRLSLLLPVSDDAPPGETSSESQVERALRHVEHAADRCAEFAQLANGNEELWRRSQETWEWIRKYLTALWVESEVDGRQPAPTFSERPEDRGDVQEEGDVPSLPGAAATLNVAARALRATPLAVWRETMGPQEPDAPTREEAVQTLLGVARMLGGQQPDSVSPVAEASDRPPPASPEAAPTADSDTRPEEESDPDQVSFDFAKGYDEGYQMGRRVGLALGTRKGRGSLPRKS
jgi:hypothetical protein